MPTSKHNSENILHIKNKDATPNPHYKQNPINQIPNSITPVNFFAVSLFSESKMRYDHE